MDPSPPLLALRIGSSCHALETGRDYLLGSAAECDLRLPDVAAHAARIETSPAGPTLLAIGYAPADEVAGPPATVSLNGRQVPGAALAIGDQFVLGPTVVTVVVDDGSALLVPIPALRAEATSRRQAAVRIAAAALRREEYETLQELMAHELRRAPWFGFSLLLHALLLLLLWMLMPSERVGGRRLARATVDIDQPIAGDDGVPNAPEVAAEPEPDVVEEIEPPAAEEAPPIAPASGPAPEMPPMNVRLAPRKRSTGRRGDGGAGLGSLGFQQAVRDLQETGLEIVFVFDSTGSMSRTISATKNTIVQMLSVLHFLVPDARVALVTFRDRDSNSEYVVRQALLDDDYWRATNFVQFISAEGGGDRPEDVHAGLSAAFGQQWSPGARRVVVLAGDAPPHRATYAQLMAEVRGFVRDGRSFVHTLVTSPDRAGADTEEAFRDIATNGRGICEPLDNHNLVLQRVLTLAFGSEFDRDVQEVTGVVERAGERVDTASLHLVRQGGDELRRALQQEQVPIELWNALIRRPRRDTGEALLEALTDRRTPTRARHAVAAALQHLLDLPVPPIDPERDEPPGAKELERVRRAVARMPE